MTKLLTLLACYLWYLKGSGFKEVHFLLGYAKEKFFSEQVNQCKQEVINEVDLFFIIQIALQRLRHLNSR